MQPTQPHVYEHNFPDAKHSQYNLRHLDFLHLQGCSDVLVKLIMDYSLF